MPGYTINGTPVRTLIFDVGGVLLDYRWKALMQEGGLSPEGSDDLSRLMFGDQFWTELDRGVITEEDAAPYYCEKYPQYSSVIRYFLSNWSRMPVDRPAVWARIPKLRELGYQTYILSNYPKKLFAAHTGGRPFMSMMDGVVVSCDIQMIKPEPQIYHYLLDTYGLDPAACLFFDDREANTAAARREGIAAVTVPTQDYLLGILDTILMSK